MRCSETLRRSDRPRPIDPARRPRVRHVFSRTPQRRRIHRPLLRLVGGGSRSRQIDFPFGSDFQAEFEQADPARAAADYARLTEEIKRADAAAANASLDDTFTSKGEVMSLRMIYLHMIEEYARHLGHADLLREQIDGATGE